jgi:hypothetical protein
VAQEDVEALVHRQGAGPQDFNACIRANNAGGAIGPFGRRDHRHPVYVPDRDTDSSGATTHRIFYLISACRKIAVESLKNVPGRFYGNIEEFNFFAAVNGLNEVHKVLT